MADTPEEFCTFETHHADMDGPAEQCCNDAVGDTERCEKHQDYNMEPDPDAARNDRNEGW